MNCANLTLGNKYVILSKIGSGSFGTLCLCYNTQTNKLHAIKLQSCTSRKSHLIPQARILQQIQRKGFPKYYLSGTQHSTNFLVMQLLGESLQYLFSTQNRKFSVKTTVMLGIQMIQRLQTLHNCHYIHRDIKPQNFLMGIGKKKNLLYLVDFGLSNLYRDKRTLIHIRFKDKSKFIGTQRYVSVNVMSGLQPSRRDDLYSVGYLLAYFLKGNLPWQGVQESLTRTKKTKILNIKLHTPVSELFQGFPEEFGVYINACRALRFDQEPDYSYLKGLLKSVCLKEKFVMDSVYDWLKFEVVQEKSICEGIFQSVVQEKREEIEEDWKADTERGLPCFKDRKLVQENIQQNSNSVVQEGDTKCLLM